MLLALLTLGIAWGIGRLFRRVIRLPPTTPQLDGVLDLALGLGLFGTSLLALGLVGGYSAAPIAALLILGAFAAGPQLEDLGRGAIGRTGRATRSRRGRPDLALLVGGMAGLTALCVFLQALAPPISYDGLMYHLVAPQVFLDAGRLIPYPENWFVNGPVLLELVFGVGLSFGDDAFPATMHAAQAVALVVATFALADLWLGRRAAWLSTAVMLGMPVLPIWASFAYIDFGWALFELLALACLVRWRETSLRSWLACAGLLAGFAMASKVVGVFAVAIVAAAALVGPGRRLPERLRDALSAGGPAALVVSPWYFKNWLWFGNPVYPAFFGGPGWSETRLALLEAYVRSFGVGREPLDVLLLPWNVYAHHESFGAVANRIDFPSLLFPLAALYPLAPAGAGLSSLLALALARIGLWWFGSQQLRFLLPVYPILSLATSHVIGRIGQKLASRPAWRIFLPALCIGFMFLTLAYQWAYVRQTQAPLAIVGLRSRRVHLQANVDGFAPLARAVASRPAGARILLLADGRGYYCGAACVPPDELLWVERLLDDGGEQAFQAWLSDGQVSHVMLYWRGLDFMLQHDPTGNVRRAAQNLQQYLRHPCFREMDSDTWTTVFVYDCGTSAPRLPSRPVSSPRPACARRAWEFGACPGGRP